MLVVLVQLICGCGLPLVQFNAGLYGVPGIGCGCSPLSANL